MYDLKKWLCKTGETN